MALLPLEGRGTAHGRAHQHMARQKHTSRTVQELLQEDPMFGAVAKPGKLPIRPLLVQSGWHSSYRDLAEILQENERITVGKSIASVVRAGQEGLTLDQADQWSIIPRTQAGTYYILVRGQSEPGNNTPITLLRMTSTIIAAMIGTATTPLMTADHTSARIGSMCEKSMATPTAMARAMTA